MTDRPVTIISSHTDPDTATALAERLLSDDAPEKVETTVAVPFIEPPPDTSVRLPGGGIMDPDGTFHDEAVVRELTGADEEALSKADATKSMSRYVQVLVRRGTESIGKYEKLDDNLLGELLVGDREMLILAIRRATYGNDLKLTLVCPSCTAAVDATFDLSSDIPIDDMGDERKRIIEVPLRRGRTAKVRIATAADQDAVLALQGKTVAEMNSAYLARCLVSIDGMPCTRETVLGLGIRDRQAIIKAMNEAQPGPKYGEVNLECPGCGRDFPMQIGIMELFRG